MIIFFSSKWLLLLLLLFTTCFLVTQGRRGGGGSRGGSRGSSSRGSSSRGSSSGSSSSRGSTIDRSRDRGYPSAPAPPPRAPEAPKPNYPVQPKPSAPEVNRQPAHNPNYPAPKPDVNQQPPPYSPRERPPPYSPNAPGPQGAPPPYNPSAGQPGLHQSNPNAPPPPYSPSGVPGANYPRQPGFPQQGGIQTGSNPQQGGIANANYPRQPGIPSGSNPQQGGLPGANYPKQPGMPSGNYPQQGGIPGANYPKQPGIAGANYPRQPGMSYPPQTLGSNVWRPQSGMPAPAYMNYGGLPTGANIQTQPLKQKGFLGSLMGMGSHKTSKNKYYGSQPSPYGMAGMGAMGGMGGGFMGKHGKSAAMYSILPYMAARHSSSFYRPRFGFMPIFLPSPFYHHHHYGYNSYYGHTHYDVYNKEYVGRCNRPLTPENAKVICNSTNNQVDCDVTCLEGYLFPDNTTKKDSRCWHVSGVWKPMKNFPACKAVCNETCLNGGTCIKPGVCGCPPEYRGSHCEYHFLNCDVRKLAKGMKIRWVCSHSRNETTCKVKCKPPSDFETPPEAEYKCTPEGIWTPKSLPLCVAPDAAVTKNITEVTTEGPAVSTKTDEIAT